MISRIVYSITLVVIAALASKGFAQTTQPAAKANDSAVSADRPGWNLVWADEFDHPGLPDPTKWTFEAGFLRNNEPQLYTWARKENCRVEDGHLIIECRKERMRNPDYDASSTDPGRRIEFGDYTSADLTSTASWTYGRIECRAKLPKGSGVWPAFWTLGEAIRDPNHREGWPLCGEIDIMEFWGKRLETVRSTIHYAHNGKHASEGEPDKLNAPWQDFHVYAAEWYADHIDFFVDDTKFYSVKTDTPGKVDGGAFNKPHFILLNFALEPKRKLIDESALPQQYVIDYVRVYQKADAKP